MIIVNTMFNKSRRTKLPTYWMLLIKGNTVLFGYQAIIFVKKAITVHKNNTITLTILTADLLQKSSVQQYTSHVSSPYTLHDGFSHPFTDWHPRLNVSCVTLEPLMWVLAHLLRPSSSAHSTCFIFLSQPSNDSLLVQYLHFMASVPRENRKKSFYC